MQLEPQVTFKNVAPSDFVLDQISARLARLEQKFGCIRTCRVVFARPYHRLRKDARFRVDLVLTLGQGVEIAVARDAPESGSEDPKDAVRDAFELAARRLCQQLGRRYEAALDDRAG